MRIGDHVGFNISVNPRWDWESATITGLVDAGDRYYYLVQDKNLLAGHFLSHEIYKVRKEKQMGKKLDLTKVPLNEYGHVQTRAGRPVRLLSIDRKDLSYNRPVVGLVDGNPCEVILCWTKDGTTQSGGDPHDLIPVKKKVKVDLWFNVYPAREGSRRGMLGSPCLSRGAADSTGGSSRIACIRIEREVEEGEGLEPEMEICECIAHHGKKNHSRECRYYKGGK